MNPKHPGSPLAMALSFIDCINRGDIDGLGELMHEEHELVIFAEAPTSGRANNIAAWRGYAASYPGYLILPRRMAERGSVAAVLGHTLGSTSPCQTTKSRN